MVEEAKPARSERGKSPYSNWQKGEGIPLYQGAYIENLYKLELGAWPRLGQPGAIINLADQEHDDGWLVEIAPGEPFRGAFENAAGLGIHVQNPQIGVYDDHAVGQRFERRPELLSRRDIDPRSCGGHRERQQYVQHGEPRSGRSRTGRGGCTAVQSTASARPLPKLSFSFRRRKDHHLG